MTSIDHRSEDKAAFVSRRDHRAHAAGRPSHPDRRHWATLAQRVWDHLSNRLRYCSWMDKAWTVMLYRQGLIELETARKLLGVLAEADNERGRGGEDWLKEKLDGDEHTASAVNLGRTMQEPMARMAMRETLLDVFDVLHEARRMAIERAEEHVATMMAGQSHMSHAQPTTYGQYLLTVHDGFARAEEQLALAYKFTNMNSGGCGACSGTGWPVDRQLITELLGFDELIELVYDCEASQDEVPQILFAMSNLALTLNRTCMDHEIWCLEEVGMMSVGPGWEGLSSFMPQKAHSGLFEDVRVMCNEVFGQTMTNFMGFKNEPVQDTMAVYVSPFYVYRASGHLQAALGMWSGLIRDLRIDADRMKQITKEGYSGAPDLAIVLIRDYGYGSRQAHRICANAVRMARERGVKPYAMTGALLDEAAGLSDEPLPGLSTAQVQECMSLDHFFEKHCNVGDPCPSETRRLAAVRRQDLERARERQTDRRNRLAAADERLESEIAAILNP